MLSTVAQVRGDPVESHTTDSVRGTEALRQRTAVDAIEGGEQIQIQQGKNRQVARVKC